MAGRSQLLRLPVHPFLRSGWPAPGDPWPSPRPSSRTAPFEVPPPEYRVAQALRTGDAVQLAQGLAVLPVATLDRDLPAWLHLACQGPGRSGCLAPLLERCSTLGIDPLRLIDLHGVTPLMRAASYGDLPMVQRLLPWCPVDARDHQGHDALWRAADHGHVAITLHLARGGDPARYDPTGRSAWTQAARREVPDTLRALLRTVPPPDQAHLERALDAAFQDQRWRNTQVLVQAMDPAAALARLRSMSGPWIEDLCALAQARETVLLNASAQALHVPHAPATRFRARL